MTDPTVPKITIVPQYLEVTFRKPGEADEICYSTLLVGGDKRDHLAQLRFKEFKTVKGKQGKDLFELRKVHVPNGEDLISIGFTGLDVPDWDANNDGILEDVKQPFDLEAKFKNYDVVIDPEIIIKKPGG